MSKPALIFRTLLLEVEVGYFIRCLEESSYLREGKVFGWIKPKSKQDADNIEQ